VLKKTEREAAVADAVLPDGIPEKLEMASKGSRHATTREVPGASTPQLRSEIQKEDLFR
jgi:hypothetical protein